MKGIVDENNKNCLGFVGMHGNPVANIAVQNADCIFGLGYRYDDRTTGNIDGYAINAKNIINVNIELTDINKTIKSNLNYIGDCELYIMLILIFFYIFYSFISNITLSFILCIIFRLLNNKCCSCIFIKLSLVL